MNSTKRTFWQRKKSDIRYCGKAAISDVKKISFALTAILLLSLVSCGQKTTGNEVKNPNDAFVGDEQIYFSADNPGKWGDYKIDHQLKVEQKKDASMIRFNVEVPLKVTTEHYIEKIVFLDPKGKEQDSMTFDRGQAPKASFWISAKNKGQYAIVAKCNLHDMWRVKVLVD